MNEQQFAERVRRSLNETSEHLPYRVTHRLEAARKAALAQAAAARAGVEPDLAGQSGRGQVALGAPSERRQTRTTAVLSLLLLIAGLVALSVWTDLQKADENAEVDMAVLTDDDVPISGYADRGFGVFLKNSRE